MNQLANHSTTEGNAVINQPQPRPIITGYSSFDGIEMSPEERRLVRDLLWYGDPELREELRCRLEAIKRMELEEETV